MHKIYESDLKKRYTDYKKVLGYLFYIGYQQGYDEHSQEKGCFIQSAKKMNYFNPNYLMISNNTYSYKLDNIYIVLDEQDVQDALEKERQFIIEEVYNLIPEYLKLYLDTERYANDIYSDIYDINSNADEVENLYYLPIINN